MGIVNNLVAATNRRNLTEFDDYYVARRSELLRDFDRNKKHAGRILASHYGDLADTIWKEARREYEALIPKIPYIGGRKNPTQTSLIRSTWALALFRALKNHGKAAEEAGNICYEMTEAPLYSYPGLLRNLVGRWYFRRFRSSMEKAAAERQKRLYPEDSLSTFIQGDGKEFDFGMDTTECAICKFFHAQGADELTPYMCLTEFAVSKALSMGLVRTTTLAEGGEKCDPRYKRGRETIQSRPSKS